MINDIDKRISRYLEFYGKEEPALLLHVRCLNRGRDPGRQSYLQTLWQSDFHRQADRRKFFDDLCAEVHDENRLHPLDDDYLPSGKIVWGPIFSVIIKDRPIIADAHSSLGFTVMNFYMFRMAAGTKYPASFVALNASVIYVSFLVFGAISGTVQEAVGYAWLFILSILVSLPAFAAIPFLNYKLDER